MSLIVAGRFTTFAAAQSAAGQLFAQGFLEEDISLFFVNPRGQHAHPAADSLHTVAPGAGQIGLAQRWSTAGAVADCRVPTVGASAGPIVTTDSSAPQTSEIARQAAMSGTMGPSRAASAARAAEAEPALTTRARPNAVTAASKIRDRNERRRPCIEIPPQ